MAKGGDKNVAGRIVSAMLSAILMAGLVPAPAYAADLDLGKLSGGFEGIVIDDVPRGGEAVTSGSGAACVEHDGQEAAGAIRSDKPDAKAKGRTAVAAATGALDVNAYKNNAYNGDASGWATFDVYVNGSLVANDVNDYNVNLAVGSKYEVVDIKTTSGHVYKGGTGTSGTIVSSGNLCVLWFNTTATAYTLCVQGTLNGGSAANSISTYGTYNLAVGGTGTHVYKYGVSSYSQAWVPGMYYKIYGVSAKSGYAYLGSSTVTGTTGTAAVYPKLAFATTYAVKFNGNGSTSGSMSNEAFTYTVAKALTANAFKRTGYAFSGWNTKADGSGTSYKDKASVKNLTATAGGSVTLYAQWKANTYSVKYNANGGTGTMSNSSHTYNTAKALTANAFKRTGYIFSGWNTKADGSGTAYKDKESVKNLTATNNGVVNLYAQWTVAKMTIKYHVNGGSIATSASAATRYRASSGSIVQKSTDSGSTWANATTSIASTATYKDLLNVGTPKITRAGYHVSGTSAWKTTSGLGTSGAVVVSQQNTADSSTNAATTKRINGGTQISANVTKTLYVNWIANTYSVTYNANGGSGTMSSSTHAYGTAKNLAANAFTRPGYAFAGWNTAKDGSGTSYNDQASVKNLTAINGDTVTLFAQWSTAPHYTVTLDPNGGNGAMGDVTFLRGKEYLVPTPAFTKEGAFVSGWKDGKGNLYALTDKVKDLAPANGTATLYAQWSPNTYTVTYAGMEGAEFGASHPAKAAYGTAFTVDNPSRTGYEFAGWDISGLGIGAHRIGAVTATTKVAYEVGSAVEGGDEEVALATEDVAAAVAKANELNEALNGIVGEFAAGDVGGGERVVCTGDGGEVWIAPVVSGDEIEGVKAASFANLTTVAGGTVSFTATWEPVSYAIAYAGMEGAGHGEDHPASATYDEWFTVDQPTRDGYEFKGWDVAGMDSTPHSYETGDVAYWWSGWSRAGDEESGDRGPYATQQQAIDAANAWFGEDVLSEDALTYAFGEGEGEGEAEYEIGVSSRNEVVDTAASKLDASMAMAFRNLRSTAGTVTFTATWEAKTYTVSFDAGGGMGAMEDVGVKPSEGYTVPSCGFTRARHDFVAWSGSDGNTYRIGDTVPAGTFEPAEALTLTAVWDAHEYTGVSTENPDADGDGYGDNIALSVTASVVCIVAADGSTTMPTNGQLRNLSDCDVYVSSVEFSESNGFHFVDDIDGAGGENAVRFNFGVGSADLSATDYLSKADLPAEARWNVRAGGSLDLAFSSSVANVTQDITLSKEFGRVRWYVKEGSVG